VRKKFCRRHPRFQEQCQHSNNPHLDGFPGCFANGEISDAFYDQSFFIPTLTQSFFTPTLTPCAILSIRSLDSNISALCVILTADSILSGSHSASIVSIVNDGGLLLFDFFLVVIVVLRFTFYVWLWVWVATARLSSPLFGRKQEPPWKLFLLTRKLIPPFLCIWTQCWS
jgi:hypothetical protein